MLFSTPRWNLRLQGFTFACLLMMIIVTIQHPRQISLWLADAYFVYLLWRTQKDLSVADID